MRKWAVSMVAICLVVACKDGPSRKQSVWDLYDVRYPVPQDSRVPVSRATIYDRYTDNDEFYTAPTFGSCGSDNIGVGACP